MSLSSSSLSEPLLPPSLLSLKLAASRSHPLGIVDGHSEVRAVRVRAVYFGALGFEASGKVQTFRIACMRISSKFRYLGHIHGNLCFHVYVAFSSDINSIDKAPRKKRMYEYQL